MNAPSDREVAIFNTARRLAAEQRAGYLDEACAEDAALRQQIEELLQACEAAGGFLPELELEAPTNWGPTVHRGQGATMLRTTPVSEQPGCRIGRYRLLQRIGEGGCGVVYLAEQEEPVRRQVALKVIKLGMDTELVIARFEAERQALALMDHPHIAKVLDGGATEAGRPYFVMELVKGIPITRYCDESNLSAAARLGLFAQVCQAIQHAHQKGVIHRDIKPSNILVTDHEGLAVPKIIDFGIAKATTGQRLTDKTLFTALEQFIGTPAYMSPEQTVGGVDIDTRTDIYSLGVLLYELLTGSTPFGAKRLCEAGLDEIRHIIVEEEPLHPSAKLNAMAVAEQRTVARQRQTDLPRLIHLLRGDLDCIAMKAMDKDRTRRYATANGLAMDILRYLAHEPVLARPSSKVYRLRRLVRRNALACSAVAAVATALLGGTTVSIWQAVRARHAERVVEQGRLRGEQQNEALRLALYVNEMNVALRYAAESNFLYALRALENQRPKAGQTDLRGFEWRYLFRLCKGNNSFALPRHNQVLGAMEFSPDGHLLATYCWDRKLRLWDLTVKSSTPVFEMAKATGLGGFSEDGHGFVFGTADGTIHFYEIGNQRLTSMLTGAGQMIALAMRKNLVVTRSDDSVLKVRDLSSGEVRFTLPNVPARFLSFGYIDSVAIDSGGKVLAVVEPRTGPEGLARDLGIHLWDPNTGKDLGLLKEGRQIHTLRFSQGAEWLAVGDGEGIVNLWDLATRQSKSIRAHEMPVTALAFAPDSGELATGSSDGSIRCWATATGLEVPNGWRGHAGGVSSLAYSPNGQQLASGSRDSPVKVWAREPGEDNEKISGLFTKNYANFAFAPDGKSMAAGCQGGQVKLWTVDQLRPIAVLTGMQYVVSFTSDSKHLLASTLQGDAFWWDLETRIGRPLRGYDGKLERIACVDLSPDRRVAALGLDDGSIEVLDMESGTRLGVLQGHSSQIRTVRFSVDGLLLVSGGSDRLVKLWDVKRMVLVRTAQEEHKATVCAAVISHDGRFIASGCGAGTIKIWTPTDLTNSLASITCHWAALRALDFSWDGATLASGGEDKVVKLWNLASLLSHNSHQEVWNLVSHDSQREVASFPVTDKVRLVEFSPDNNVLAIVTDDGVLRLLRAVSLAQADRGTAPSAR